MSSSTYSQLAQRAANWAISMAVLLIIIKLVAWWLSGSMAVLASLTDSLFDACTSLMNLIALRIACKPADYNHRFGHGKAEALAGLAQGAFIAGSGILLLLRALEQLAHPTPLKQVNVAIIVMIVATIFTALLVCYQRSVVRRTGSVAIRADMLHYQTDILMNGTVLVSLLLSFLGWWWVDAVFAIAIVFYMLWAVRGVIMNALRDLMDQELPDSERQHILALTRSHQQVRGCHELRTRQSAEVRFIQMHIELDDALPLVEANKIAHQVEDNIRAHYPNAEVLIHQDPVSAVPADFKDAG